MSPEQAEGREVARRATSSAWAPYWPSPLPAKRRSAAGSAPTLAYRAVYRQVNLDRVPAELRGLIECCLAKDPASGPPHAI